MHCGACGQKSGLAKAFKSGAPVMSPQMAVIPQALRAEENRVAVTYMGQAANHYIPSPSRKVRHYGYGGRGMGLVVHREDVLRRPDLFYVMNIAEAKKVWPNYPTGAPEVVVSRLGASTETNDERPTTNGSTAEWPEFSAMTIQQIKDLGLDKAGWEEVLRQEEQGLGRKTLVEYAKTQIAL